MHCRLLSFLFTLGLLERLLAQTYKCQDQVKTFTRGDNILICLHYLSFSDPATVTAKRLAFQLKVDEYTGIQSRNVYGSYMAGTAPSGNVNITISTNASETYPVLYITPGKIYPIFSIVVQMVKGEITDIFWDNVCFGGDCGEYNIVNDGSTETEYNDYQNPCTTDLYSDCDAKVYVSFLGTDADGTYMSSAGMRMSRYRQFSTTQVYSNSQKAFSNYKTSVSNSVNDQTAKIPT